MRIAIIQLNSQDKPEKNLDQAQEYILEAIEDRADLVILPEYSNYLGPWINAKKLAEDGNGIWSRKLKQLSDKNTIAIAAGLVFCENQDLYSSLWFFAGNETEPQIYKKLHLFKLDLNSDNRLDESSFFKAGNQPLVLKHKTSTYGLALCYDLRFPELFRFYSRKGVEIILLPSAFTQKTGKAHWKTLCRARAIENQCFLLAANQVGSYSGGESFGHSLVVGPWGDILIEAPGQDSPSAAGVFIIDIKLHEIEQAAGKIPVLKHRRDDLFYTKTQID